jgi:uncharacterized protein YprB with RNaseH-like and TPR domain
MLPETFTFLPGVGRITEEKIRTHAKNWDEFLNCQELPCLAPERKVEYNAEVIKAKSALEALNPSYFATSLPRHERWRLMPHFRSKMTYLDIETTGLSPNYAYTTVVGINHGDGKGTKLLIRGEDLSEDSLRKELAGRIPVTFNGSRFDLPFLKSEFPGLSFDIDIDLRFVAKRLGYFGGLKRIEKELGIARDSELEGMDGFEAVRLWKDWEHNQNKQSLSRLLHYNRADVDNLAVLADLLYGKLAKSP